MSGDRQLARLLMDSASCTRREDLERGMETGTWEAFVAEHLSGYRPLARKDGPCFIPARYKPPSEWRVSDKVSRHTGRPTRSVRLDANVAAVTMVVLDLDAPGALDRARERFAGREHVIHRTYSWTAEKPHKYRLVAPLAQDVPAEQWKAHVLGLLRACGADTQRQNPSGVYYLPATHPDNDWTGTIQRTRGPWVDAAFLLGHGGAAPGGAAGRPRRAPRRAPPAAPGAAPSGPADPTRLGWTEGVAGFSEADLAHRFRPAVEALDESDSRHAFALKVTMAAAGSPVRCGDERAVTALTAWMLRTASRHGSRPMESGNTLDELPEMFASAWDKARGVRLDERAVAVWVANAEAAYRRGIDPAEPNGEFANPWGERYEAVWRRIRGPVSAAAAVALIEADVEAAAERFEPLAALCMVRRWAAVHGGDAAAALQAVHARFGRGVPEWEAAWALAGRLPGPGAPANGVSAG